MVDHLARALELYRDEMTARNEKTINDMLKKTGQNQSTEKNNEPDS